MTNEQQNKHLDESKTLRTSNDRTQSASNLKEEDKGEHEQVSKKLLDRNITISQTPQIEQDKQRIDPKGNSESERDF